MLLLDFDDVFLFLFYEFLENDYLYFSILYVMNVFQGSLGRIYFIFGIMFLSRSGVDFGVSLFVLKRRYKVEFVEDDIILSYSLQDKRFRCKTFDLFTVNNKFNGFIIYFENLFRSVISSYGKYNKILFQSDSDFLLGSYNFSSNRSGFFR